MTSHTALQHTVFDMVAKLKHLILAGSKSFAIFVAVFNQNLLWQYLTRSAAFPGSSIRSPLRPSSQFVKVVILKFVSLFLLLVQKAL